MVTFSFLLFTKFLFCFFDITLALEEVASWISSSASSSKIVSASCSFKIEETSSAAIATDALLHKREPTVIAVTTLTPNFFLYINTPPRFFWWSTSLNFATLPKIPD